MSMSEADLAQLQAAMLALQGRVARLEAETAVRAVVAEYMRLCDSLSSNSISMSDPRAIPRPSANMWDAKPS